MTMVVRSMEIFSSERWMAASVSLSTDEVASSSTRIGGSFSTARAMEIRWRCPPDSFWPRSPTMVSYPFGSPMMKSWASAMVAAAISSSVASGRP